MVLVGGTADDVPITEDRSWKNLNNVSFREHIHNAEVPKYLKAADVLVLPNVASSRESVAHTSPIKMFEYMDSRRPILAARLPSITEILNDKNSFLFKAGDGADFERVLNEIVKGKEAASLRAEIAKCESEEYTWKCRADRIGNGLKFPL